MVNGSYFERDYTPTTPLRSAGRALGPADYVSSHGAVVIGPGVDIIDLHGRDVTSALAPYHDAIGSVLERYAGKLAGVRHIVQSEPDDDFLLRPDVQRGVSLLAGFEMTYDILIFPRHLPAACRFADRNPDLPLVLDHLAKPPIAAGGMEPWATDFRALARRPHVFVKASGLVTEAAWTSWTADQLRRYLDVAFEAFGPERILFGSDFPVCRVAASYAQVKRVIDDYCARLSDAERARVLADNAIAFYRLAARSAR